MPRRFKLLLAVTAIATACAAGRGRPPVDKDAMKEAQRAVETGDARYASSKAYYHYLRARLAESEGDFRTAADELKLALVYDDDNPFLRASLAEIFARLGLLERAEDEAKKSLTADRNGESSVVAHLLLGKIYSAQKRRDKAVTELKGAIEVALKLQAKKPAAERRPPDADPWRLLGAIYLEGGDEAAAAKTFEELSVHVPGEGSGFREMGRMYFERRDPDRAEKYFKKALEKDPGDSQALRQLAYLYESRRRYDEARATYETALRVDSEDADTLVALGKLSLRKGDLGSAKAYFRQLIAVSPDDSGARVNVAFAYIDAKRTKDALEVVDEAVKAGTADGRVHFVRGIIFQDQKKWSDAATAFALITPEDAGELFGSARMNLGYCLSQAGRHKEADEAVAQALVLRPKETRLVTMLALIRERAGKPAEAIALLQETIDKREADPASKDDVAELYDALASSLQKAGRAKDAVGVLKKALQSRPRDEALLYALGNAYEKSGDTDAAVAQMKSLVGLNPDHADALNFIGYTYAERGVKLDEAEKLVSRALELRPDNGYFMDSLGWVHFKKGDYLKAVEELERADQVSGPEATILEHLGDAYEKARRPSDAAVAYTRAIKSFDGGAESQVQRAALERKLNSLGHPAASKEAPPAPPRGKKK